MNNVGVLARPSAMEMTETMASMVGAGIGGVIEGVLVKTSSRFGAAAPYLTWGVLIGTPVVGVLGALFLKGMMGQFMHGVGAAGAGILGYTIPELISPSSARRVTRQIETGDVKLLGTRNAAALRAQAGVRSSIEF
jgi:hypothetical protein